MAQSDIPDLHDQLAAARRAVNCGRFAEARKGCRAIFALDPGNLAGLQIYTSATVFAANDPVLARIKAFAARRDLPDAHASQLHFMLGKALDDLGRTRAAFAAFRRANALKPVKFDAVARSDFAERLIAASAALRLPALPPAAPRMVFVLGMPRSGTSLMAQCLDAHPQITSLGEMTALGAALTTAHDGKTRIRLPEFLKTADQALLEQARRIYRQAIPARARASGHVLIDKMPENYWLAFAIPLIFPDALILHMRRDRLATCWSCYRNDFGQGHEYSYDFNNLLTQFETQERLSAAWKVRHAGHWRDVALDRLAGTPRETIAPVLERLSLKWNEACLTPAATGGEVRTLSKFQVRRGIRPGIATAWRAYEPLIRETWDL